MEAKSSYNAYMKFLFHPVKPFESCVIVTAFDSQALKLSYDAPTRHHVNTQNLRFPGNNLFIDPTVVEKTERFIPEKLTRDSLLNVEDQPHTGLTIFIDPKILLWYSRYHFS